MTSRATLVLVALFAASPLPAQEKDGDGPRKPGPVERVASEPLRDLNIVRDEVPPLLAEVRKDPYSRKGTANCTQIAAGVRALDAVLGEDVDGGTTTKGSAVEAVGKVAAGSILPASGLLRIITGASANARNYTAAIFAGSVRRGFLKGLGAAKGCRAPAAP